MTSHAHTVKAWPPPIHPRPHVKPAEGTVISWCPQDSDKLFLTRGKGQGDIFGQQSTVTVLHTSQITRGVESSIPCACSVLIEPSTFIDDTVHRCHKTTQRCVSYGMPAPHLLCLDINSLERSEGLISSIYKRHFLHSNAQNLIKCLRWPYTVVLYSNIFSECCLRFENCSVKLRDYEPTEFSMNQDVTIENGSRRRKRKNTPHWKLQHPDLISSHIGCLQNNCFPDIPIRI